MLSGMKETEWPELMTVAEAGLILRKKQGALRHLLRRGMIKGVMIGGRWMVTADEVRRVIAEGTRPAKPVELAGGRVHPGHVIEDDADQPPPVDPDQLRLDLARRGGGGADQARRDPGRGGARIIG